MQALAPYTPGEQPSDRKYIKLNTNESPFPPTEKALRAVAEAAESLQLYPALDGGKLRGAIAESLGVSYDEVIVTNGSDEVLNLCFRAFCSPKSPAAFADITYGFYPVFAGYNCVPYEIIPLKEDFTLDSRDYIGINKTVFIANPNAPTGIFLPVSEIEEIIKSNPDNVVVVDEAYIDFGGESCVPLVKKYKNLVVTQTFSKSRSMAGARLGFGIACPELINDLYRLIYSTNPYNLSRLNMAAGLAAVEDSDYTRRNCAEIAKTREDFSRKLKSFGFEVLPSIANFVFAKKEGVSGRMLCERLRAEGILVRRFDSPRISDWLRITIGSRKDMNTLAEKLRLITENLL